MRAVTMRPRAAALGAATALAVTLAACGTDDTTETEPRAQSGEFPETLVLASVPAEDSTDMEAGFDPLVQLLEAETGATVEFRQASDYAGVIEGMIADNVDLAFFGPFSYVIARENGAEIEPVGTTIAAEGEPSGYESYGLTQGDDTEINELADFAGKDVCFVDPGSTSGFLYPTAGLIEAGVIESGTEEELSGALKPIYAGAHDASALAIKAGDCDAGFAMSPMVDGTLVDNGELAEGDLKKVWTSERIAGSLFAARSSLGGDTVEALNKILTEKGNADYLKSQGFCDGDCLITTDDAWGIVPAKDADYDGVRSVCEVTQSDTCTEEG